MFQITNDMNWGDKYRHATSRLTRQLENYSNNHNELEKYLGDIKEGFCYKLVACF